MEARGILERLVRIPSQTGSEQAAAEALAGWCREAGLDVSMQEVEPGRPNVLATWRAGRGPHLLLTGHIDTVPVGEGWTRDPHGSEIAGGRLYGRGACDMKGGLAAMLGAIVALRERGELAAGDVTLAAAVGEEEDSAGTRAMAKRGIEVDRRLNPGESAEQVVEELQGAIARVKESLPWLEAEIIAGPDYIPFEIPQDNELVRSMTNAMQAAGLPPRISSWRAASDAGFLVHGAGIPCVLFGPGDIEQAAHRPDEWIDLEDLDVAQRVFEHLILNG